MSPAHLHEQILPFPSHSLVLKEIVLCKVLSPFLSVGRQMLIPDKIGTFDALGFMTG